MTTLSKSLNYTYIPGILGHEGTAGIPATPAYCSTTITYPPPVYTFIPTADDPYTPGNESGGYWVWVTDPNGTEVTTCYPASPAVPGTEATPATPAEIIYFYNDGWNSHSTSIYPLDNAESFYCTFSPGTVGGYIVLGQQGMEERTVGSFSHGILVDTNGVYVYEYGVLVYTLSNEVIGTKELKISRRIDNTIEYSIGDRAYTSLSDFSVVDGIPVYVYAFLYSGGDSLLTASLEADTGAIEYASVTLDATSSLEAHDLNAGTVLTATSSLSVQDTSAGANLTATSSLTVRTSPHAYLTASSSLYAVSTIGIQSNTTLGALNGSMWESPGMDQQTVNLGALTGEFTEGSIIPATPLRAQGNLPSITGTSLLYGATLNTFDGDLTVPVPKVNASFGMFGDINVPKPTVSGVFISATTINGALNVPVPIVAGTMSVTSPFVGDLDVPKPTVSGTLLLGSLFVGDMNVPKPRVSGTFTTAGDFAGDMNVPLPKVSGIIASAVDDSAWEYSESTTCQL